MANQHEIEELVKVMESFLNGSKTGDASDEKRDQQRASVEDKSVLNVFINNDEQGNKLQAGFPRSPCWTAC